MKDLRFSITALVTLFAFSLYLIGVHEAEDTYVVLSFSFLPLLGILFLTESED